ncbi:MAG: hypothetical protein KAR11_03615 [Phycisphaerae bacterium]|nr:hypothetical protein [Phycisphaerae bacterium]
MTQGCYVTGKPVILGGIPGRREATGNGVAITVLKALEKMGIDPKGKIAVVQGFGNVGSVAAFALHKAGMKIIATSDIKGGIVNQGGLDIDELITHQGDCDRVVEFDGGDKIGGKEMLELPCDVLVLAASANQITADNASRITAKIIAEGANSPTSPEADKILADNGILVIPDILCNAGGVFVSYLEYMQETQQEQMTEEEVNERLLKRMSKKFAQVSELADERKIDMREAAMYLAIKNVCTAMVARGKLP